MFLSIMQGAVLTPSNGETRTVYTPRYFDDPEHHENAEVLFGFGPYGLETRLSGTTTERFVATVQRHVKAEIARLLEEGQKAAT